MSPPRDRWACKHHFLGQWNENIPTRRQIFIEEGSQHFGGEYLKARFCLHRQMGNILRDAFLLATGFFCQPQMVSGNPGACSISESDLENILLSLWMNSNDSRTRVPSGFVI